MKKITIVASILACCVAGLAMALRPGQKRPIGQTPSTVPALAPVPEPIAPPPVIPTPDIEPVHEISVEPMLPPVIQEQSPIVEPVVPKEPIQPVPAQPVPPLTQEQEKKLDMAIAQAEIIAGSVAISAPSKAARIKRFLKNVKELRHCMKPWNMKKCDSKVVIELIREWKSVAVAALGTAAAAAVAYLLVRASSQTVPKYSPKKEFSEKEKRLLEAMEAKTRQLSDKEKVLLELMFQGAG